MAQPLDAIPYPMLPCPALSHRIPSHHIDVCPLHSPCPALLCPVPVLIHPFLISPNYPVLPCAVMSCPILSCLFLCCPSICSPSPMQAQAHKCMYLLLAEASVPTAQGHASAKSPKHNGMFGPNGRITVGSRSDLGRISGPISGPIMVFVIPFAFS